MGHPEFLNGLNSLRARHRGCVATIGSFDGVHRGHKAILEQLQDKARELALPSLVMVFEPQPHEYFSRRSAPARLMRLREKVCALFAEGVDRVLCLKFDEHLRSLTAQAYIDKVLIAGLRVKYLVIGDDFRFGCDRAGDFAMLCRAGAEHGFTVSDTRTQLEGEERISSTRIRGLLEQDRLDEANLLLGRPYSISGRVTYGKRLGRSLGFPTLNIALGRYRSPVQGVYAVSVGRSGREAPRWDGVANVGLRPTVDSRAKPLLEVHLLDRQLDLYGELLTVIFRAKIRCEKRFSGLDELKSQIQQDAHKAREYFAHLKSRSQVTTTPFD